MSNSENNLFIKDNWFTEKDTFKSGHTQKIKIKNILYHKPSKYQDVLVFESEEMGNILALDGAVQCCEKDEFAYQEMISYLPVNSHESPSNILVIGGGDGGVLRELDRHPLVKNITLCEIDQDVITVSKRFLPKLAVGFQSPKANVIISDAFDYLEELQEHFDVIICDLSDPDGLILLISGPSEKLYTQESIKRMHRALKPNGMICLQSNFHKHVGESFWLSLPLVYRIFQFVNMQHHTSQPILLVKLASCSAQRI